MKKILIPGWVVVILMTWVALDFATHANASQSSRPPSSDFGPMLQESNYTPQRLTLDEAQAEVDYRIPKPAYLPQGAEFLGSYIIDPPYDARYPAPASEEARRLLNMKNRARSVKLVYHTPQGEFGVYLSNLVLARPDVKGTSTFRDLLAYEPGVRGRQGDFEFVKRTNEGRVLAWDVTSSKKTLTQLTWFLANLEWHGWGQVLQARMTIEGTLPEQELVQIAQSVK